MKKSWRSSLTLSYSARFAGIALVFFALIGGFALTNEPRYRYENYPAQCQMIYGQDSTIKPIDLVVMGSSRSMRVMQADMLGAEVAQDHGFDPVIFDMSRSYRDMGHMYVFINDMLQNNTVNMLLVEYKENGDSWYHPHFDKTPTTDQLFASIGTLPSEPLAKRLQDHLRLILDRGTYHLTQWISGKRRANCVPSNLAEPESTDPSSPWFVNSELLTESKPELQAEFDLAPPAQIDLDAGSEERSNFYVEKIVELARSKGVEPLFYYIPPLYGPEMSADFILEFEERFQAQLLQLPKEKLEEIYVDGFTDLTHMGVVGAEVYMDFLAQELPWQESE